MLQFNQLLQQNINLISKILSIIYKQSLNFELALLLNPPNFITEIDKQFYYGTGRRHRGNNASHYGW